MAKPRSTARRPKQTTTNISMPESLRKKVEARVLSEGFGNVSEYFRHLVREDERRRDLERRRLVQMVREGIASGPPIEMTDVRWRRLKAELKSKHTRRRAG